VAFVLPSFAGGGAERVVLTLIDALDRSRLRPSLFVLNAEGPLRGLVPPGTPVVDLATPRLRAALPALLRALRRARPDAVVSTLGYLNLAVLALRPLLRGRPRLIVREANPPSVSIAATRWPRATRFAYRRLYPRTAAVLCNAETTAAELRALLPRLIERILLLPNPIDVERLRVAAEPPIRAPGDGLRLVAAGRLTHQKGFDRLIDMMAALPASSRLTILGTGPDEATLRTRAESRAVADRVTFAGFAEQPWPFYAGADAFLLPSRWEGQSNAALEALAVGTPVIATPEAGGIATVAASAPAGAVTIAATGEDYVAVMKAFVPAPVASPRPSLLPAGYEPAAVAARLADIIEGAVG